MLKIILVLATCALGQQIYQNPALNAYFEAPAGWVFDAPDTGSFGSVTIRPNRVGLNPAFLNVTFSKHSTFLEAFYYPGADGFYRAGRFYAAGFASPQAPTATLLADTTIGLVHYSSFVLRQIDLGAIQVYHGASNQTYSQSFTYATTIADYNANSSLYNAIWLKTNFISLTGTPAKVSSLPPITQAESRQRIVDAMGRRITPSAQSPRIKIPIR